jgi:hypothetical protein
MRTTTTSPASSRGLHQLASRGVAFVVAFLALVLSACDPTLFPPKVELSNVNAGFAIAEATWFEDEQTLFFFYRVNSEQGLSDASQIEVAWLTDESEPEFLPLSALTFVHEHVPVDCGTYALCGSASVRVSLPPRNVQMRLRYHKDGTFTLPAEVNAQNIFAGPAHTNRSAIVYGVLDENNVAVQWRLRHQFPGVRNEDAQALGLRRLFSVQDMGFGNLANVDGNPYSYGFSTSCPSMTDLNFAAVETNERAIFVAEDLPLAASSRSVVCGTSTVSDALGPFSTPAIARKNPQVAPAFGALQTPVRDATTIGYFLQTCSNIVSDIHRTMQLQRTQLSESDVVCIDDFASTSFVPRLAERFQQDIDAVRVDGNDMVLVLGLQRPDNAAAAAAAVEAALELVVDGEADKATPRLAGAFVFDSAGRSSTSPAVATNVLWCPSGFGGDNLENVNDVSPRECAIQATNDLVLGPLRITSLPILPTRRQYLTFVDNVSEEQAGRVTSLSFRAPLRTTLSETISLGEFGSATFFNNEAITIDGDDSFSYCPDNDSGLVLFRVEGLDDPLPISVLPDVQEANRAITRYALGLAWDFPFYADLKYEAYLAGAVTVADFTIAFGPKSPGQEYLGSDLWQQQSFDVSSTLTQCSRFCDHPTFDSKMVYNVLAPFRSVYRSQCYDRVEFPARGDGGFPADP